MGQDNRDDYYLFGCRLPSPIIYNYHLPILVVVPQLESCISNTTCLSSAIIPPKFILINILFSFK